MYDRRQVLLQLAAALGGATALSACGNAGEAELAAAIAPDGALKFYTPEEYDLISKLSDAILPRTDTPGALDVGVPDYLDGMMHAWASKETRAEHRKALGAIGKALGKDFTGRAEVERAEMVSRFDAAAFAESGKRDALAERYRSLKSLIAQIYYSTEPGASEELHIELVPGRWDGDAPLSEVKKTWYN